MGSRRSRRDRARTTVPPLGCSRRRRYRGSRGGDRPSLKARTARGGGVEHSAVVGDLERQMSVGVGEPDDGSGRAGVLGHVLERLERAEVDGGLHLLVVPTNAVGLDGRGDGSLERLRIEGGRQAAVGEQRRIDTAGEVAEIVEGAVERLLEQRGHRRPTGSAPGVLRRAALERGESSRRGRRAAAAHRRGCCARAGAVRSTGRQRSAAGRQQLVEPQQQLGGEPDVAQDEPGREARVLGRECSSAGESRSSAA